MSFTLKSCCTLACCILAITLTALTDVQPKLSNDNLDQEFLNQTEDFFFLGTVVIQSIVEYILNTFGIEYHVTSRMDWKGYHDFEVAQHYLDILERNFSYVSTEVIGTTWENRSMRVVKICRGQCGSKPAMFIQTGIHAREWITQAVGMFLIKELAENYKNHYEIVDDLDWYILPFANPDGYEYSRTNDRSWRKNRNPLENRTCPHRFYHLDGMFMGEGMGVDLNRNFGYMWNTSDSSDDPCSQIYQGSGPFSEPETVAIRNFVLKHQYNIAMFNDIHAFSQFIFTPWAHTKSKHPNIVEITRVANIGNEAIKAVHGKAYRVGCGPCLIYGVGGDGSDWAAQVPKIRYPFSMEIRGTGPSGRSGFELPAEEIIPTGQEIWAFHKAVAEEIIRNFKNRKIGL